MSLKARLASQSTIIFAMRIAGAGLVVLAQAAMARLWGGDQLGEYLLVMALVNLAAMVMPLGFQSVGTYFAAEYRANGQGRLLGRFLARSLGHVLLIVFSISLVGFSLYGHLVPGLQHWRGEGIGDNFVHVLVNYWVPGTLLAAAAAVIFVNGAILVGLKRPFAGFFADGLFRPLLVIASFGVATLLGQGDGRLGLMLWVFAGGYWLVACVHLMLVVRSVGRIASDESDRRADGARWWRFALPWVLIDLATLYFFDIDLIMLSGLMDSQTLAIFGICTRMFSLMAFGVTAVYAVSLPDVFESAAAANRSAFYGKLGDANLVAAGLSLLMFAGILVVGPFVLMIFGPAFTAGTVPLAILSLSLLVRSIFGPAALVLSIHDRPWSSLPSIGAGLLTLAVGNLVLVPLWGLTGAALAALSAFSVWSALMWVTALHMTRMDVSIWPRVRRMIRLRGAAGKESAL